MRWIVVLLLPALGCGTGGTPSSLSATETSTSTAGDTRDSGGVSQAQDSGLDSDSDSDASTGDESMCQVVGVAGECIASSMCDAVDSSYVGLCSGPPAIQCCIREAIGCSRLGAPGLCVRESDCADPWESTGGICPGGEIFTCCSDPLGRCDPLDMPLPNEGLLEEAYDGRCPSGMVWIDAYGGYCMDRYEASLRVVDAEGNDGASFSPYHAPIGVTTRAVSLRGSVPQAYVSRSLAAAACGASSKRLCSEFEWEAACIGEAQGLFPYGPQYIQGACNEGSNRHPAAEYFGTQEPWIYEHIDHPCLDQLPNTVAATGEFPACVSSHGVFDMMGNVSEWTASTLSRGGHFVNATDQGPGCYFQAGGYTDEQFDFTTGFRCCADAL